MSVSYGPLGPFSDESWLGKGIGALNRAGQNIKQGFGDLIDNWSWTGGELGPNTRPGLGGFYPGMGGSRERHESASFPFTEADIRWTSALAQAHNEGKDTKDEEVQREIFYEAFPDAPEGGFERFVRSAFDPRFIYLSDAEQPANFSVTKDGQTIDYGRGGTGDNLAMGNTVFDEPFENFRRTILRMIPPFFRYTRIGGPAIVDINPDSTCPPGFRREVYQGREYCLAVGTPGPRPSGSDDDVPETGPDRDGDGIPDADDLWPDNPNNDGPIVRGTDTDGDGIPDGIDRYPNDPTNTPPVKGTDTDGDGIPDGIDRYPNDPTNTPPTDDSLIISEDEMFDDVVKKAEEQLEKDLEGLSEEEKKTWRQKLAEWFRGRRLAKGKTPGLSLGWPTWLGTGVIGGGIAKVLGGGSGSGAGGSGVAPGITIDATGGLPGVDTPGKALEAAKADPDNWAKMNPAQQQGAQMAAQSAAPGSLPSWLLPLLGLAAMTGENEYGGAPSTLQEAAARRSMEVYGNADLFNPIGGAPLTAMDPRFKNLQSFMPAGEVPDFNLGYRGMPGQLYANYGGIGPLGTPGPQGNMWATQPLNRGGTFQPPPPQQNYVPINQPGGIPGVLPFNNSGYMQYAAGGGEANFPRRNGQIAGPGTETSDDIPAMLSDGEFVVNAKAVRGIGNLMGKRPKSKAAQRREGARAMYELQRAGEQAARMA